MANKIVMIIKNETKKKKTCLLIDVGKPADIIVTQKEAEKKVVQQFVYRHNMKCTIVPVITGATGIVTNCLKKNLEAMPRKHSIY